jgi:cytochrome c(L)
MMPKEAADNGRQRRWAGGGHWVVIIMGYGIAACLWILWPLLSTHGTAHAQEEVKNPFGNDPQAIQEGYILFQRLCVPCHGAGARGDSGPNLTDDYWRWGDRDTDLFATITAGRPNTQMGAFGGRVTAIEIWKLIAYIRSQYQGKGRP